MKNDGSILNGSEVLLLVCLFAFLVIFLSGGSGQGGQDQGSGQGVRTGGPGQGCQDKGVRTGGTGQGVRTGGSGQEGWNRRLILFV